jgi:lysosomal acid lipase/cholesteryl ester hydrolase
MRHWLQAVRTGVF